jgi:hypothetical protein
MEEDATASWTVDIGLKSDNLSFGIHKSILIISDVNQQPIQIPVQVTVASPLSILPDRVFFDSKDIRDTTEVVELKLRSRADIAPLAKSQIKIINFRPIDVRTELLQDGPLNWTLRVWRKQTSNVAFRSEISVVLPAHVSNRPILIPVISLGK